MSLLLIWVVLLSGSTAHASEPAPVLIRLKMGSQSQVWWIYWSIGQIKIIYWKGFRLPFDSSRNCFQKYCLLTPSDEQATSYLLPILVSQKVRQLLQQFSNHREFRLTTSIMTYSTNHQSTYNYGRAIAPSPEFIWSCLYQTLLSKTVATKVRIR